MYGMTTLVLSMNFTVDGFGFLSVFFWDLGFAEMGWLKL